MTLIRRAHSQLLLVDYQTRLAPAIHQGEAAIGQALRLMKAARRLGAPIRATEQAPGRIGPTVDALAGLLTESEIFSKTHFSAAREPGFDAHLAPDRPQIVIGGMEAHVCVLQTAMDLRRAGCQVFVVADAVGSRLEADKAAALARMREAGIAVVTAEMVLFEWLEDARDPAFRDLLPVIKG